ncbi:hypothetical protein GYMLUDRAFT_150557 [Collybiopsis luxurians FD-317 M1]|nr:hypothetical protein GYMLUDRAFT_150557 [Collybiopsis luxurians FD-317 M1]
MKCSVLLLSALSFILCVTASAGDRSADFQQCLSRCEQSQCIQNSNSLPLALRLTRWACPDNCKYLCMHEVTAKRINAGEKILQYYGKWPFWRFAGIQEPASVAFSLLNLWAHVKGAQKLQLALHDSHPMKKFYMGWSLVSMNTWIWSSVFHTRDTPLTERLDYFSAALTILTALYFTVVRLFHLYAASHPNSLTSHRSGNAKLRLWSAACILVFLAHVSYLALLERFDYTYNVIFNLTIGLAHNFLWTCYSFPSSLPILRRFPGRSKVYRPRFAYKPALLVPLMTAAMALELFDFAPWMLVIDAHSLWHFFTAPIALMWYSFLIQDANDESWKEQRLS